MTGIVRRIDDLARIVIPKEIRRIMRITEGDPLEIKFDSENKIITLSPYNQLDYRNMWEDLKRRSSVSKETVEEIEKRYSDML